MRQTGGKTSRYMEWAKNSAAFIQCHYDRAPPLNGLVRGRIPHRISAPKGSSRPNKTQLYMGRLSTYDEVRRIHSTPPVYLVLTQLLSVGRPNVMSSKVENSFISAILHRHCFITKSPQWSLKILLFSPL